MSEPGNREPTDIVAYDDTGAAITDNDLLLESYREPLPGVPLSLLPPYEWEGTDDEWEEKQLIDAIKERRRRAATARISAAGPKRGTRNLLISLAAYAVVPPPRSVCVRASAEREPRSAARRAVWRGHAAPTAAQRAADDT